MKVGDVVMLVNTEETIYKPYIGEIGYIHKQYESSGYIGRILFDVIVADNNDYHCLYDSELFLIGEL